MPYAENQADAGSSVPGMARRYSTEEEQALYSLLCDGYGLAESGRLLAAGESPLDYKLDIPYATLKNMKRRLVARLGEPRQSVPPGQEKEAVSAARRRLVGLLKAEAEKLSARAANGTLQPRDITQAIKLEQALGSIEMRGQKQKQSIESERVAQGHETRRANDSRTLADMAARVREREEREAED